MTNDELQEVRLPLNDFVRGVVRATVREAMDEHYRNCPIGGQFADLLAEIGELKERVGVLELTKAKAVGGFLLLCFLVTLVGNLAARAF